MRPRSPMLPLSIPAILAVGLFGALLAASPCPVGAQAYIAGLRVDLPLGSPFGTNDARGVAVGDVNGDGMPDLLALTPYKVTVLLGNGLGGFGSKSQVALDGTTYPFALAVGDLNGDGRLDLAVVDELTAVSVLLGNGAGGFGPRTVIATGSNTADVTIADMTGDGRPDLVVAVRGGLSLLEIFPGNGAGGFGARQDISVPGTPTYVATGDLNGDGRLDVCVSHVDAENKVSVLLANATGGYLPPVNYTTGFNPEIAIGDVNGDGKLDLVTTDGGVGNLSVFLGDGTGMLGTKSDYAAAANVREPVIADMNGDGLADVAFVNNPGTAGVMLGNGTGAFAAPSQTVVVSAPYGLAVGDLNGDGRPDLTTVSFTIPAYATVLFNGTGGEFRTRTDTAVGTNPRGVTMGDVNGDGRPDLAVANAGANTVSVLLGAVAGGFAPKADFAVGAAPVGMAIGDVTGDGRADLVVTNSGGGTLSLLPGNGVGGFGARTDVATGAGPVSVVLADLNGDGRLDAAVANNVASKLSVLPNNGAGGFGTKTDYTTGLNPASVAVGDLNADGLPDLVVSNGSASSAGVFLGTGSGTFGARTDFATGTTPLGVALGDLNGDSRLDLAVTNSGGNSVSVLLGNGTGGFGAKVDYPGGGSAPSAVAIGDVNGDGRLDLSVANAGAATVSVLLGTGLGNFSPSSSAVVAGASESIAIGDLNGDGRLDVVAAAKGSAAVSVLLGLVPTKTTLSVPVSPIVAGGLMVLNASTSVPAPGIGTPADYVQFFDGNTLLGTSPVVGGSAGLALFAPYRGDRAITAVYRGDGKLFGSISNVAKLRVVGTAAAAITKIADVASDQGGQARLTFARSPYDYLGSGTAVTGYQVYRRAIVAGALKAQLPETESVDPLAVQLAGWDYLVTVPATTDDIYQVVVPTVADSNGTGIHRAVLFVRAATATPGVYYDSPADSGYTVDNLAPAAPSALTAAYAAGATHLHWAPNGERDFASYRVYRGASAGFVPAPGNLLASPPDTGFADAGPPGSFYKVSAVDANGNQSLFALVGPDATTDVEPAGTAIFALEHIRPNPATVSRLVISFSLPTAAPARLEVFDVRGRRVAAQDVGGQGAGRQAVRLPSAQLAPGVYVVRLSQGAASMTQRMTVVE